MKTVGAAAFPVLLLLLEPVLGHVTLRPSDPLHPGRYATVRLVVPNERHVDNTTITLEIPESFLEAGGRVSKVDYPPGWHVVLEREETPAQLYMEAQEARRLRHPEREEVEPSTEAEQLEQAFREERLKAWIKRIRFEGGSIPPDGFKEFQISLQLPTEAGDYRFPSDQLYQDGTRVSWSELVEGAAHPAPTLLVEAPESSRSVLTIVLVALLGLLLLARYGLRKS